MAILVKEELETDLGTKSCMNEISIKILSDGKIMIERGGKEIDEKVYDLLSSYLNDSKKLKNFLFQWKGSELISGFPDLCG